MRIIARNYPDLLTAEWQKIYQPYLDNVYSAGEIVDYKQNPRYTVSDAFNDMATLRTTMSLDAQQQDLLQELETYLTKHFTAEKTHANNLSS